MQVPGYSHWLISLLAGPVPHRPMSLDDVESEEDAEVAEIRSIMQRSLALMVRLERIRELEEEIERLEIQAAKGGSGYHNINSRLASRRQRLLEVIHQPLL